MRRALQSVQAVLVMLTFSAALITSCDGAPTYWNVFNIEQESVISASIVTYATLSDMLADTNRIGSFQPNPVGFGTNIVGSGATIASTAPVPEPGTFGLLACGAVALLGTWHRKRRLTVG